MAKAIMLVTWNERNIRVFEEEEWALHHMISDDRELIYDWSRWEQLSIGTKMADFNVGWENGLLRQLVGDTEGVCGLTISQGGPEGYQRHVFELSLRL